LNGSAAAAVNTRQMNMTSGRFHDLNISSENSILSSKDRAE
jgi:hypothetical protein